MLTPEVSWLRCLRRYLSFLALGSLLWEALHMPLYSLWNEGTWREIVVFGLHCTGGDVLIGASSLLVALVMFATPGWPSNGYWRTVFIATLSGFLYTFWSEWYNVSIAGGWAYSDAMPIIPVLGIGLSPLAQWLVIPIAGFSWARL